MPTIRELQAITRRLRRSGIDSIEIKGDGYSVRIRCGAEEASCRGAYSGSGAIPEGLAACPAPAGYAASVGDPASPAPADAALAFHTAPSAVAAYPASPPPNIIELGAPMPGRIWLQDPLTGKNIAADGRTVKTGDLLALVQAGPICLPLRAAADGQLDEYTVAQGDRVEYGQPVARMVKTEAAQ
ncbi:acetyl-CoA carboxylase biotin carboxyl carrier protein subunit [Erwinia sp. S38]|uniref:acetyl-CoA carboxylase biotin carboxyl carrier protein n=1 Tax=Erwinia sp. S38 TaxID=2769338 RepID=UPI00190A7AAA|nr:acetyl-CoA carboxylase biotin carboxyl carrier protein subunit [Erwinia sp. S38]MBK0002180.1 hypothetical protein [Erwinia sp. S38]